MSMISQSSFKFVTRVVGAGLIATSLFSPVEGGSGRVNGEHAGKIMDGLSGSRSFPSSSSLGIYSSGSTATESLGPLVEPRIEPLDRLQEDILIRDIGRWPNNDNRTR